MPSLADLGWCEYWEAVWPAAATEGAAPARVVATHRDHCRVLGEAVESTAVVSGRLRHHAQSLADYPAVGDWVAVKHPPGAALGVITAILPRRNKFSRRAAGPIAEEQIVAANLDTLFLATSLNRDWNVRRIERYLAAIPKHDLRTVLLVNKIDLAEDWRCAVTELQVLFPGVDVIAVSALTGAGIEGLEAYFGPGQTVAMVGSSGVGKSTLLNRLLDAEQQETGPIREKDDRGRHVTSHREMFRLPQGGWLIDNPGMRELQLWEDAGDVDETFADVLEVAARCRYGDCTHGEESGCAVRDALEQGQLDAGRFANYLKLQRELAYVERQRNHNAARLERLRWRKIHKAMKKHYRERDT